jgi:lipopolysaccharide heptosyltransferase I
MSDILFIKTSSLGDVIHHMPALTEARYHYPQARISWVVEEAFAPLVRLHPAAAEVIPVASRRWRAATFAPATWREIARFLRTLQEREYNAIVDTQGLVKSALIARLARGCRHGYDGRSIREPAAAWLYDARHSVGRNLHAVARNRILTARALGYAPGAEIDFGLSRGDLAPAAGGYGLLLHGTARPQKEWPETSWVALGRELGARRASLVVPWGTEPERTRAIRIASALAKCQVPDRQPLDRVAALIAGASFVIGVDTGLLHLAAALGVPLVAIFIGSDPGLTGPVGRGPIAIIGGKNEEPSVSDVLAALERIA